jgi:hypothetical protein
MASSYRFVEWGLCASCLHRRDVPNPNGRVYLLCERSRADPAFPRYPRLPVTRCAGFTAAGDAAPAGKE